MKKQKKVLALVLCAVMLVASSVMVTMAYLTHTTGVVTNTFTVGNVSFNEQMNGGLDEARVDEYGVPVEPEERVTGNAYKLIPGHEYTKDPTVHMGTDSENAWLFVKVDNGLAGIEAATTIADQMKADWSVIDADNGIYAYNAQVAAGEDVVVFKTFTLTETADVAAYEDAEIVVQAYAVQADGFDTAVEAWAEAPLAAWTTAE